MEKKDAKVVVDFYEFTKDDYEYLVDKCMLNDELALIFKYKIQGNSNTEIMMKLRYNNIYLSEATLSRRLKILKKKIMKAL